MSDSAKNGNTGKFKRTDEMKIAQSQRVKGKIRTEEMKEHYRQAAALRVKKICPYCQKEMSDPAFSRYHGDKCKQRSVL